MQDTLLWIGQGLVASVLLVAVRCVGIAAGRLAAGGGR